MTGIKITREMSPQAYREALRTAGVDLSTPQRIDEAMEPWREAMDAFFQEDERPVMEELWAAGHTFESIEKLHNYEDEVVLAAAPILFKHLSDRSCLVRESIAGALHRKGIRPWWHQIRDLYVEAARIAGPRPANGKRSVADRTAESLASLLSYLSAKKFEPDILELVEDESLGESRIIPLVDLGRSRCPEVLKRLEALVDTDPYIQYELKRAIKKIKAGLARQAEKARNT